MTKRPSILDQPRSPFPVPPIGIIWWTAIERVTAASGSRDVYDISRMTRNEAEADADKVTAAAATADGRILLQNFLLVVERELKRVTNRKSGASESDPDSTR
jgi:hypothetical protein